MMSLRALGSRTFIVVLLLASVSATDVGAETLQGVSGDQGVVGPGTTATMVWFSSFDREDTPFPPTYLHAEVDGDDVVLTWEEPATGPPSAYRIYRMGLPNADGSGGLVGLPSLHVVWPPLRQVSGQDTTFRDDTVDLSDHHYVYAVTAAYGAPAASTGYQQSTNHANGYHESPPSNPAYTRNTFGACPWFDVNIPEPLLPPAEVYVECIHPLGPTLAWPMDADMGSV